MRAPRAHLGGVRGPVLDVASGQGPGNQLWQSTMEINYGNQLWRLLIAFVELIALRTSGNQLRRVRAPRAHFGGVRGPVLDVASEQGPGNQPWESTMAINYGNQLWRSLIAFVELIALLTSGNQL